MARRNEAAAQAAANAASEAARTLQARQQEVRQEQPQDTAPKKPEPKTEAPEPRNVEKMLGNRPHKQAMDDLLKRRGLDEPEEEKATEKSAEAPVEARAEPTLEKSAETTAKSEAQPEAPKTVRVKVDGEEFDAPADDVEAAGGVKSYQMQKASENRLAKANSLVEESRKQMAQFASQLQAQSAAKQQPAKEDFIKDRINKIRFGTDEEASAAMAEVIGANQPKIDQQQIYHQTSANLKHEMADAQFKSEFADVLANPLAQKLSQVLHMEALAPHSPNGVVNWQALSTIDWGLFKRNIGNQLRSAFGRQSQPTSTTEKTAGNPSPASAKEERKASIVNLPTAAARAEMPKEEKEPTPDEARQQWLAETKKRRGQV